MESKRSNPGLSALGGLVSGAALGFVCLYRDMKSEDPSLLDKMKAFENRLYNEGKQRADEIEEIKREAERTAAIEI